MSGLLKGTGILHDFLQYLPDVFYLDIIFYLQGLPSQISLITSQYQDVSIVLSLGNLCYCEIKLYFLLKCLPGPFFLHSIPINSRPHIFGHVGHDANRWLFKENKKHYKVLGSNGKLAYLHSGPASQCWSLCDQNSL